MKNGIQILGLLLFVCTVPLQAQNLWRELMRSEIKNSQTGAMHSAYNISGQLSRRAALSYQEAKQLNAMTNPTLLPTIGNPVRNIVNVADMPGNLYPDVPFLDTSSRTANYFTARNNRLFIREQRKMVQFVQRFNKRLPDLKNQANQLPQPAEITPWLMEHLPQNLNNLYIGESHGYGEISQAIANLMPFLRKKYPQREIIMFSEFLPKGTTWDPVEGPLKTSLFWKPYFSIWDQAAQNHIQVIGLEEKAIMEDECWIRKLSPKGKLQFSHLWTTLEGLRIRNEQWTKILSTYRAEHPDALFIIHTGADHSLYNRPFTLTAPYREDSFVAVFYPAQYEVNNMSLNTPATDTMRKGPLENLTENLNFPQRVLYWQDPELVQLSGFNARFKIQVTLKDE